MIKAEVVSSTLLSSACMKRSESVGDDWGGWHVKSSQTDKAVVCRLVICDLSRSHARQTCERVRPLTYVLSTKVRWDYVKNKIPRKVKTFSSLFCLREKKKKKSHKRGEIGVFLKLQNFDNSLWDILHILGSFVGGFIDVFLFGN